ncbi:hypothetical protein M885DRAFT_522504 [Pelagophyceae sp. CCMP2097]|nr:hypothetical protein M885DRAFT_522504 [Pelagophyceae sp. CCMP2097]
MGMAIAKILGGDVKGGKAVLAKRKTPMMKELEAQAELETGAKQRRLDKAVRRAVGVVQPDPVNLNSERALRKIATRAVVALFNSISEHQRAADGEGAEAPQRAPARRGGKRSAARTPAEEAQRAKFEALQDVRSKSSAAFDVLNAESFDDEAPSRAPKFTNNWARDDFLLDSKMDDWDDDAPKPTAAAPKPRKQNDDTPGPFLHHKKDRAKR